jgi:hypothetical protein
VFQPIYPNMYKVPLRRGDIASPDYFPAFLPRDRDLSPLCLHPHRMNEPLRKAFFSRAVPLYILCVYLPLRKSAAKLKPFAVGRPIAWSSILPSSRPPKLMLNTLSKWRRCRAGGAR